TRWPPPGETQEQVILSLCPTAASAPVGAEEMEAPMSAQRAEPGLRRRVGKTTDAQGQRAAVEAGGGAGGYPSSDPAQSKAHFRQPAAIVRPVDSRSEPAHGSRRHGRYGEGLCSLVRDRPLGV